MEQYSHLSLAADGPVWRCVLERPEVGNALNPALIGELISVFRDKVSSALPRILALSGSGRFFCSGADLGWMAAAAEQSAEQNYAETLLLWDLFEAINAAETYTIAAVHGGAFGGGLGILACCDCVIAAADCRFSFSEVKLGLAPATIAPFVAQRIGISHCRNLMLSGRRFGAWQAQHYGLVDEVVEADVLGDSVAREIELLRTTGPEAVRQTKRLLLEIGGLVDRAKLRESTARLIAELRASAEGQEGVRSFLEKRRATWDDSSA